MKYYIEDWAGNICFHGKDFDSFDDAEEFLTEELGDAYETDRGEYYIVENKGLRDTNYIDPNDPRNGKKSA